MTPQSPVPEIGGLVEIDQPAGPISGTVATRRQLAPNLWQLVLTLPGGRDAVVVSVARAEDGGWHAAACQSIGRAIATARRIAAGETLHSPVNITLHDLADAVLALSGHSLALLDGKAA